MPKQDLADLVIILSHELGCALEMSYEPHEIKELWGEALEALKRSKEALVERGFVAPGVVENIIHKTEAC